MRFALNPMLVSEIAGYAELPVLDQGVLNFKKFDASAVCRQFTCCVHGLQLGLPEVSSLYCPAWV